MAKKFIIENIINNTIIYKKVNFDCLSMKQRSHLNRKIIKKNIANYFNSCETSENININYET
jgi:hypothetical protein